MNRKGLISALANQTGSNRADAERNILALFVIIGSTLKMGDKITLAGFGIFEVHERAARIGRSSNTGETLRIKTAKVPTFKAGSTLKEVLNGGSK